MYTLALAGLGAAAGLLAVLLPLLSRLLRPLTRARRAGLGRAAVVSLTGVAVAALTLLVTAGVILNAQGDNAAAVAAASTVGLAPARWVPESHGEP